MKKMILIFAISLSGLVMAQKEPIREIYTYQGKNDMAMVKAKTDLFWLNVLSSNKFEVQKNSTGVDHLDINILMPFSGGKISSRVRYDFMKHGYVVSLSNTKLIGNDGKSVPINNPNDESHNKVLQNLKNLVFSTYEKELSK